MPSGNLHLTPLLIELATACDATSICDVGPGYGKHGLLAREYLQPDRLDAVEAEARYLERFPWLHSIYDVIHLEHAEQHETWDYDLVLMIEVLEHIDKDDGLALLDRIPGWLVVCTPAEFFQNREADEGWETERHRSLWTVADFGDRVETDASTMGGVVVRLRPL